MGFYNRATGVKPTSPSVGLSLHVVILSGHDKLKILLKVMTLSRQNCNHQPKKNEDFFWGLPFWPLQYYWSLLTTSHWISIFRYLYADLYAAALWAGTETPEDSGNFTSSEIPFTCASDSPLHCSLAPGTSLPALGYIFSFGEDNRKDVFVLASSGVYRVVRPSRCNYTCSKEKFFPVGSPGPSPSNSLASQLTDPYNNFVLLFSSFLLLLLGFVQ